MSLKLEIEVTFNVVSGYPSQLGRESKEKGKFWTEVGELRWVK